MAETHPTQPQDSFASERRTGRLRRSYSERTTIETAQICKFHSNLVVEVESESPELYAEAISAPLTQRERFLYLVTGIEDVGGALRALHSATAATGCDPEETWAASCTANGFSRVRRKGKGLAHPPMWPGP